MRGKEGDFLEVEVDGSHKGGLAELGLSINQSPAEQF